MAFPSTKHDGPSPSSTAPSAMNARQPSQKKGINRVAAASNARTNARKNAMGQISFVNFIHLCLLSAFCSRRFAAVTFFLVFPHYIYSRFPHLCCFEIDKSKKSSLKSLPSKHKSNQMHQVERSKSGEDTRCACGRWRDHFFFAAFAFKLPPANHACNGEISLLLFEFERALVLFFSFSGMGPPIGGGKPPP